MGRPETPAMRGLRILAGAAALVLAAAEFRLDVRPDVHLYARLSPKLRLTGTDFTQPFTLTVATDNSERTLVPEVDYTLANVTSTQITMKKMAGVTWGDVSKGPAKMFLNSMVMDGTERIQSPVVLATVVPEPMIYKNMSIIYQTETRKIVLRGEHLSAKVVRLSFDPPLQVGVDYMQQIVSDGKIALTLQPGKSWAAEPGPLKLTRIDTGPGPIRVSPPGTGGLVIAEVQADMGHAAGVVVLANTEKLVYQDTDTLSIGGAGFNLEAEGLNLLAFANGIRGQGNNFTVSGKEAASLTLSLTPGSVWRSNPENLPGPLILLAMNTGKGWVPLGSGKAKRGRIVARVFQNPKVNPGEVQLYQGQTHMLKITGEGFVQAPNGTTTLTFDPPIDPSLVDVDPLSATEAIVMLHSSAKWREDAGPVMITAVDTGPGPRALDPPVKVGEVVDAAEPHASGISVTVTHSSQKIYSDQKQIAVLGSNFVPDTAISVEFKPGFGPEPEDFTAKVESPNTLVLTLNEGKQWVRFHTIMIVTKIVNGEHTVDLANGDGMAIATAYPAPDIIMPETPHLYASHSKSFYLRGYFGDELDSLKLEPTTDDAFEASIMAEELIQITLKTDKKWAEVEGEASVELKVTSMDLGAGPYAFPDGGLAVATIYADAEGVTCDDSCMYATNGMCDDGSDVDGWAYDNMDDDFGLLDDDMVGDDDWYSGDLSKDWADNYGYDDDFIGALCEVGTDCTDCGGVQKSVHTCDNTCEFAKDYVCDDPRGTGLCELGSDCDDCGEMGAENEYKWEALGGGYDDDGEFGAWFEDDDYYLNPEVDDDGLIYSDDAVVSDEVGERWEGWIGADGKRYTTHAQRSHTGGTPPTVVFVSLLQALAYSIGAIVIAGGCFVFYTMYKGGGVAFPIPDNSSAEDEVGLLEKGSRSSVPVTPDEVTTNA